MVCDWNVLDSIIILYVELTWTLFCTELKQSGGFLAGHCVGQYPDVFKVAATRNPVMNIASMVTATDIPDWCYIEALGIG